VDVSVSAQRAALVKPGTKQHGLPKISHRGMCESGPLTRNVQSSVVCRHSGDTQFGLDERLQLDFP
jgi:hypothetical protein